MTKDPVTVGKDAGIFDAIRVIKDKGVRRLPIVDGRGKLVGILTVEDLTRLLSSELADLACVIEQESPTF
jgi:CBS domain-containing protein